jgi:hypothetical protein
MARILIFDSGIAVDSNGNAVSMVLSSAAVRSKALHLFGTPDGDVRNISYEFILSGGTGAINVYWYQEFFNDSASLKAQPSGREFPGANVAWAWAREQTAQLTGSGVIEHYNVERRIMSMNGASSADCRWFPMLVHSLWTRLAIWTPSTLAGSERLKVFASVGGYDAQTALEAGLTPYAGT